MGRTLFAEERLQPYIDNLYAAPDWSVGLLIGQLGVSGKDCALHLVSTPLQDEGSASPGSTKPSSLETLPEFMVTTHAKQALRMLPGGLQILGVYASAPADAMQRGQLNLKQLLYAVQKTVDRSPALCHDSEEVTERYVLQVCPSTRKLTCRTFDITDSKSGARPAELKFQSSMDRWQLLSTRFSIDFPFPIPTSDTSTKLVKQIQKGLSPLCDALQRAVALVDGKLLPESSPIDTSSQKPASNKKGKRQRAVIRDMNVNHSVDLYMEMPCSSSSMDSQLSECGAKMLLRGTIEGRAFVHHRATVKEATQAIKTDVLHSLLSRCELLCEDLLQTEEEQDPKVLYEMPVRVFASLPNSHICLCDYMFQDETASDSCDRFKELLGLEVQEDAMELNCERIPTDEELSKPVCRSRHSSETQTPLPSGGGLAVQYIGAVVGGIVAAIAAGVAYLYLE